MSDDRSDNKPNSIDWPAIPDSDLSRQTRDSRAPLQDPQTVVQGGSDMSSRRAPRTASNISQATAGYGVAGPSSRSRGSESAKRPVRGKSRRRAPHARRMGLSVTHVDPWSVAKVTFLLSVAGGIIQIVAISLMWVLLNAVGVFDQVSQLLSTTGLDAGGFSLSNVLSLGTVLSVSTIFSIVEVVLVTLLAVIIAALYNVISQLVGGVHITVGDD
ncbi:DUF3566 domain-containing protein [Bifidobacterium bombi]|uniref:Integral membrane protein n=1 Tax=Bifidobacterium bombi DSM 19703 TaxID=1341695 RepID=A0A086BPD1_9BIFI|nr:DUF3566 domain-containing protein [Bifidobacterium bombi]KFF31795.1 integral membrane protein [Bifidobacterium bombi DSM 19703]